MNGHDPRWWVTAEFATGVVRRYPFTRRENALGFMESCIADGLTATLQAPRDPMRPWQTLDAGGSPHGRGQDEGQPTTGGRP